MSIELQSKEDHLNFEREDIGDEVIDAFAKSISTMPYRTLENENKVWKTKHDIFLWLNKLKMKRGKNASYTDVF